MPKQTSDCQEYLIRKQSTDDKRLEQSPKPQIARAISVLSDCAQKKQSQHVVVPAPTPRSLDCWGFAPCCRYPLRTHCLHKFAYPAPGVCASVSSFWFTLLQRLSRSKCLHYASTCSYDGQPRSQARKYIARCLRAPSLEHMFITVLTDNEAVCCTCRHFMASTEPLARADSLT